MKSRLTSLFFVLVAACSTTSDPEIVSVSTNAAGITALQTQRGVDGDTEHYELRALGANDEVVGTVTLQVTPDAALAALAPDVDNHRADIRIAAGGEQLDAWSRAIGYYELRRPDALALQQLLEVPEVAATLERDVNIHVASATAVVESAYTIEACVASQLLATPVAQQCCAQYYNGVREQMFINGTAGTVIGRKRSADGAGCRGISGSTTCSGQYNASTNPSGCYYGPNAWAITMNQAIPSEATYQFMTTDSGVNTTVGNVCNLDYYTQQQMYDITAAIRAGDTSVQRPRKVFADVTGTYPRGYGCSNGTPVPAGGGAALGAWDY